MTNDDDPVRRIRFYNEFAGNMQELIEQYGFGEDQDIVAALYSEVINQKTRLVLSLDCKYADQILNSYFTDAYKYYTPHSIPDCFLYFTLLIKRAWPMKIEQWLHTLYKRFRSI